MVGQWGNNYQRNWYVNSLYLCDPEPDIILGCFFYYFMHMGRPFALLWRVRLLSSRVRAAV